MKDLLLSPEELQKFAIGYIEYPGEHTDGDIDWSKPIFHKGHIPKVYYDIAHAQLDHALKIILDEIDILYKEYQHVIRLTSDALFEDDLIRAKKFLKEYPTFSTYLRQQLQVEPPKSKE